MSQALVCSLLVLVPALLTANIALAHDSWINRGAFKNGAGDGAAAIMIAKATHGHRQQPPAG